jgi:phosphatidylglycerol lysyltransferase
VEHTLRVPSAPNGTVELLIDHAMRVFADREVPYVTLGLAPLAGPVGRGLRTVGKMTRRLYSFEGLRAFKAKLLPQRWDPIYIGIPEGTSPTRAVYDVLVAFAPGGPVRFGLRTILRIPDLFLRVLASLLVPWTLALALVDSEHWFPQPWIQWAWVLFDCGLIVLLFALIHRWRKGLATLLATLVSLDAVLTLVEALQWNLPNARGGLDYAVMAIAVGGPVAAATLLWRGWLQRARWVED